MTIHSTTSPAGSPPVPTGAQPAAPAPAAPAGTRFVISAINVRRMLLVIVLLAVALRLGSALYQGNQIDTLPGVYDQVSYDGLARRVLDGHGFSFGEDHWPATRAGEPTAHWSFLYTLYLTGVYALFGPNPLAARVIQALLAGVLQTILMWRIGKRTFGPTAGLLAAAFSAVYIYFVYYAGALITETFYITCLLWIVDIALRIDERAGAAPRAAGGGRRWLIWAELGLAIGITALFRQLVLLLVPFLFLWLWWRVARRREGDAAGGWAARWLGWRTLAPFVLAVAVVVALILPWTIRNYRVFHTTVLLNTNSGYVFFWANHPIYGTQFVGILPGDGPGYGDLLPKEVLSLNEAEMDKALLARGIGFVLDDPGRYALLSLSRTREYFKFWPSPDSSTISNISRVGSFGLFLPLMLYGVILAGVRSVRKLRNPRREQEAWRAQVWLLLGFIAVYTLMHLLTWTLIRYRLPVDAFLLVFAAYGVVDLLQRIGLGVRAEYVAGK
jgi:4-amino-4-deoxy-L-arabinose transferase-like glycosyltransferase